MIENDPKLYDINISNISEKFTDHKLQKKIERKLQNLASRFKPHQEKTFFFKQILNNQFGSFNEFIN